MYGNAWVYGNARVSENARVYGNAWVSENARVYGNSWVSENARVSGDARLSGITGGGGNAGGGNAGVGYTGGSDNPSVVNAQAEAALQAKRKAEREAELQALKDARYQEYLDLIGQVSTLDWDYRGDQDVIQTTIDRLKTLYGEFGAYIPDFDNKGSFEIFGNMPQQYYSILGLNMDGTPKTPEDVL